MARDVHNYRRAHFNSSDEFEGGFSATAAAGLVWRLVSVGIGEHFREESIEH